MALAGLQQVDASDEYKERVMFALEQVLGAHLGVCRTSSPDFDSVKAHLEGKVGFLAYFTRRRSAILHLQALVSQLDDRKSRPDGYSASELKREAGIKRTVWQAICKEAGLGIAHGNSHYSFSNAEIVKLISAARRYAKRKGKSAADAWEQLLEFNKEKSDRNTAST